MARCRAVREAKRGPCLGRAIEIAACDDEWSPRGRSERPTVYRLAGNGPERFFLTMGRRLHLLTGCTAVGKSAWALRWAEEYGAEIVSCDSLLFYRGLDIGTAKPSQAELSRIPHHLVNVVDLADQMNIARFVALARAAIEGIFGRGREVLVCGGSGFYLASFFRAVTDTLVVSEQIRAEVRGMHLEAARERLRALNPTGLAALDESNPRRVQGALERCLASGRPWVELVDEFARLPGPFSEWSVRTTELQRDPLDLGRRIEARVHAMLAAGLIEEVEGARSAGLMKNPSAARAIGYREVVAMLEGELPRVELAAEIIKNTRALVKKQRTWFRTQLPAHRCLAPAKIKSLTEIFPP